MHPFVAAQIAITFEHEIEARAAATRRDIERARPRRRRFTRVRRTH
jgi:hypothetical protein